MKKIWKYTQVAVRSIVLVVFVIAIFSLALNIYDVLLVEIKPRQVGLFLDEIKTLRFEGVSCPLYPPLHLQYIDVPVQIQTVNLENSLITLRNYNPVEIVINEDEKEIGRYLVENPLDFYLTLTANMVIMNPPVNLPRYKVGFCGDGIEYNPAKRTANSLYDISQAEIYFELPVSTSEVGIFFGGVSKIDVDLDSNSEELPIKEDTDLILTIHRLNKNEDQSSPYSMNLTISGIAENSILNPGVSMGYQTSNSQVPASFVSIESNSFTVRKPLGYIEMGGDQYRLGYSVETVTIAAPEYDKLNLVSNYIGLTRNYEYAITGKTIQLNVDDEEYILPRWDKFSPEMQNAYFGLLAAVVMGISGFLLTKWTSFYNSLKKFIIAPLLPKSVLPPPLEKGVTIFYLKSGKRIAGNLIRTTGFFHKQHFLIDVREWNGQYWDDPIDGEVQVSNADVEMRFES